MSVFKEPPEFSPDQRDAYNRGWKSSDSGADLDSAEARYLGGHGHGNYAEWISGWMDLAAGREKWEGATSARLAAWEASLDV